MHMMQLKWQQHKQLFMIQVHIRDNVNVMTTLWPQCNNSQEVLLITRYILVSEMLKCGKKVSQNQRVAFHSVVHLYAGFFGFLWILLLPLHLVSKSELPLKCDAALFLLNSPRSTRADIMDVRWFTKNKPSFRSHRAWDVTIKHSLLWFLFPMILLM